jgi:light-harvesting complex I chlorophyll a/b binding protein 1
MLGTLGFVATSFVTLPGREFSSVAAHDAAVQSGALSQVLLWTSLFELLSTKAVSEMLEGSGRAPGDFGFDPLKFSAGKSEAVKNDLVVKELSNGRLAMLAFGGLVTQAVLTGKDFPYI